MESDGGGCDAVVLALDHGAHLICEACGDLGGSVRLQVIEAVRVRCRRTRGGEGRAEREGGRAGRRGGTRDGGGWRHCARTRRGELGCGFKVGEIESQRGGSLAARLRESEGRRSDSVWGAGVVSYTSEGKEAERAGRTDGPCGRGGVRTSERESELGLRTTEPSPRRPGLAPV